ncbi:hypothetical protein CAS74_002200 [Pichia kudriavzevii]|uniref:HTH La-type RNA-binding domain-containing protein n=1 Tax=Pichia kudriavzevii TaxID=4909 RepID=A0A1Z8JPC6_PICKU|nr:hypothetical protein CAS74_002200 [Pichia kudriavzevii]
MQDVPKVLVPAPVPKMNAWIDASSLIESAKEAKIEIDTSVDFTHGSIKVNKQGHPNNKNTLGNKRNILGKPMNKYKNSEVENININTVPKRLDVKEATEEVEHFHISNGKKKQTWRENKFDNKNYKAKFQKSSRSHAYRNNYKPHVLEKDILVPTSNIMNDYGQYRTLVLSDPSLQQPVNEKFPAIPLLSPAAAVSGDSFANTNHALFSGPQTTPTLFPKTPLTLETPETLKENHFKPFKGSKMPSETMKQRNSFNAEHNSYEQSTRFRTREPAFIIGGHCYGAPPNFNHPIVSCSLPLPHPFPLPLPVPMQLPPSLPLHPPGKLPSRFEIPGYLPSATLDSQNVTSKIIPLDAAVKKLDSESTNDKFERVAEQILYYFSTDNLCRDLYLRGNMSKEGYVPISLLNGFKRIKLICGDDERFVDYVLDHIPELEKRGDSVRLRQNWERWILPGTKR